MTQISDRLRGLVQSDIRRMSRECESVDGINLVDVLGALYAGRAAFHDTARRHGIPREYFHAYLHSLDADREHLPDAF